MLLPPVYRGPESDHFDGRLFRGPRDVAVGGWVALARWFLTRERGVWRDWIESEPGPPPVTRVEGARLRVTLVNHSTVLLQTAGLNLLTDPVWSERAGPIGPYKRHRAPGLRFEDLPPIDVVLLSHNHYDHCDLPTLRRLAEVHQPRVVTTLGLSPLVHDAGIQRCEELDWWQSTPLSADVEVRAVPAQHSSGRGVFDRDRTLWCGFVMQGPSGSVYFAGDTGMGPHFTEIAQRCGPFRLALLPIGCFRPSWFMDPMHTSPAQAVEAQQLLGSPPAVAIHYGTFNLADDGETEPLERLDEALTARGPGAAFSVLEHGQGWDAP